MAIKKDKCLVCKTAIENRFWTYLWRDKRGFCCEECGHAVHDAGYKILDSIAKILVEKGAEIGANKEKFGFYRLRVDVLTPNDKLLAEALFEAAKKDFPEFSFDFDVYLKNETPTY